MKTLPTVGLASVLVSLCACATLPDERIHYRLPTTTLSLEVIRTLGCTKDKDLVEAFKVTPTVIQHADQTPAGDKYLELGKLHGPFNDADMKVEFYDDGRLKSVNGSTTGQGETILKSAAMMVGAALSVAATRSHNQRDPNLCKAIHDAAADSKTLTVTYAGDVIFDAAHPTTTLHYADESELLNEDIKTLLGSIVALPGYATCPKKSGDPADATDGVATAVVDFESAKKPSSKDGLMVDMRNPKWITVSVCEDKKHLRLWTDKVPVSQYGAPYTAFFGKPAAFGKEALVMNVAESGALTSIQYTHTNGGAAAMNALGTVAGEQQAIDTAKYNALKLKNDTIKEQKRAVLCQTDATKC